MALAKRRKTSRSNHFQIIPLSLSSQRLVVAMAQIEGPLPLGKVPSVGPGGREILSWKSREEVDRRIEKACLIITRLVQVHPEVNIVVFPEYTVPLEFPDLVLPRLQSLSDTNGLIIIPGGDGVPQPRAGAYLSQCPVILPHHKPAWVSKQNPSSWDEGRVDRPRKASIPLFMWKHDRKPYYLSVRVGQDFPTVIGDPTPTAKRPIVFVVPMFHDDGTSYYPFANTILSDENGRAVLLCNCVGEGASGASAVFVPTREIATRPAVALHGTREMVIIAEIDCDRLARSTRSSKERKDAARSLTTYTLETSGTDIELVVTPHDTSDTRERGVLNPALFAYRGKQLRMTFLGVERYGEFTLEKFNERNFELYSVLGHHDVIVTHLHHSAQTLIYDVNQSFTWKIKGDRERAPIPAEQKLNQFPYFEITAFHKVLGVPVPNGVGDAFETHIPTQDDVRKLLDLGMDWNTKTVDDHFRRIVQANRWVLTVTKREPGAIDAVMTVSLDYPDEIQVPLAPFNHLVLPELVKEPSVTSIFEGTGTRMTVHYVLRISAPPSQLFSFIQDVHKKAETAGLVVATTTYVIVGTWSQLSIRDALMLPRLHPDREWFRDRRILPRIDSEARRQMIHWNEERQMELIRVAEPVLESWDNIDPWVFPREKADLERELLAGMIRDEIDKIGDICVTCIGCIEDWASHVIRERIDEHEFRRLKQETGVQSQKTADQLMLNEKLRIVAALWKEGKLASADAPLDSILGEELNRVRNAVNHHEFIRVGRPVILETIRRCSEFLSWWAREIGRNLG